VRLTRDIHHHYSTQFTGLRRHLTANLTV
jgi:hypothetical protein